MTSVINTLFTTLQYAFLCFGIYAIAILMAVVFVVLINKKGNTYVKKIKLPFITIEFDEKQNAEQEHDNDKVKHKTKRKK